MNDKIKRDQIPAPQCALDISPEDFDAVVAREGAVISTIDAELAAIVAKPRKRRR